MPKAAQQAMLQIGDGGGPPEDYTTIAYVTSITGPAMTQIILDDTDLSDITAEKIAGGIADSGEITLEVNFAADLTGTHDALVNDIQAGTTTTFQISWPTWVSGGTAELNDTITAAVVGDVWTTAGDHDATTGDRIWLTTSAADLPLCNPVISEGEIVWVRVATATTFTCHTSRANAIANAGVIDVQDVGTGTHTVHFHTVPCANVDQGNEEWDTADTSAHEIVTGQPVRVAVVTGGVLPASTPQVAAETTYYASYQTADTLSLHLTNANAVADAATIDFTGAGTAWFFAAPGTIFRFEAQPVSCTPTGSRGEQATASFVLNITGAVEIIN